jgi:hypothetical protein
MTFPERFHAVMPVGDFTALLFTAILTSFSSHSVMTVLCLAMFLHEREDYLLSVYIKRRYHE